MPKPTFSLTGPDLDGVRHIANRLFNLAFFKQVVIQRESCGFGIDTKERVHAWRLDIGINHPYAPPLCRQCSGDIPREIRLASPSPERMDGQ